MRLSILVISFLLVTNTLQAKIVFLSFRDGNSEIYTMNSFGNGQTRLTDYDGDNVAPSWSPNGQQIVFGKVLFNRKGDRNEEIYVMHADGSNRWQVSDPLPNRVMSFEGWSPDGTQILYMGFLNGLVKDSIVIIATLSLKRRKAIEHE